MTQAVFPPFLDGFIEIPAKDLVTPSSWLVFGGPYSNLQATQAMMHEAERLGISPQHTVCTGDVVAYCAEPVETVALIQQWGCHVVMGNCEESLAQAAEDCGCGFEAGTACSLMSDQWYQFSNQRVTEAQRRWMEGLPRQLAIEIGGVRCKVVHGSVSQINEFVFSNASDAFLREQISLAGAEVVIAGHSGMPFTREVDNHVWFNAGVIGMPADDGTCQGWYGLITPTADGLRFTHHRLSYDADTASARMKAVGLNNGYAKGLTNGWWPSLDVLPPAELAKANQRRQSIKN